MSGKIIYGRQNDPYMVRWKLGSLFGFSFYVHCFLRSDADTCHDHPWSFLSFILLGGYYEQRPWRELKLRRPFSIAYRKAEDSHRVILRVADGQQVPALTFMIAGRKRRDWGFHTEKGWKPYEQFFAEAGIEVKGDGTE
jgi:hypothetical protein